MEFARRGGLEPANRNYDNYQGRRGGIARRNVNYESYFDRQGDVRLQEKAPVTTEGFQDPPINRRSNFPQHGYSPVNPVPSNRHFHRGHYGGPRGDFHGARGRGGFQGNIYGDRTRGGMGGIGVPRNNAFTYTRSPAPPFVGIPLSPCYDEPKPETDIQRKHFNSREDKNEGESVKKEIIPQVLKRETRRESAKDICVTDKQETKKEIERKESPVRLKAVDDKRTVTRKHNSDYQKRVKDFNKSEPSTTNKGKQRRNQSKKTTLVKSSKSPEPPKQNEPKTKGKEGTLKLKIPPEAADPAPSDGGKNPPISPEEVESLKALEKRLREVKLFGAEKYESNQAEVSQAAKSKQKVMAKYAPLDSEQAKSLVEQLIDGTYDCMVCCERISWIVAVWSCTSCFHIFHLTCITKWIDVSTAAGKDPEGWRCPACQNVNRSIPEKYHCFCGKVTNPEWKARDGITPHSCGNVCKKRRMVSHCSHLCTELCHPGPCPSCPVMISWKCPCGKQSYQIRCGQAVSRSCEGICNKTLKCGRHYCTEKCHMGHCNYCEVMITLSCFCGKRKTEEICGSESLKKLKMLTLNGNQGEFSCTERCARTLGCKEHTCNSHCHSGPCEECPLLPKNVTHCPCGKVKIAELVGIGNSRKSCMDPIPCCKNICQKILKCGSGGKPHYCKQPCHNGPCGPCDGNSVVSCRCRSSKKEVSCAGDIMDGEFQCGKVCKKKRSCGRHRCNTKCCVDDSHLCLLVCGKKLQCGQHFCEELCHAGYCPRCWQTSFEERSCLCGRTIQEPPIPCGTPLPDCHFPCSRAHGCEHPQQHSCHNNASCPPCPVLSKKTCMGGHETRENIPCYVKDFSCGKKCENPLPCGHQCDKTCHKGDCVTNVKCTQGCILPRKNCIHQCMAPCHTGKVCPDTLCCAQVKVHCPCGRRSAMVPCKADNATKDSFSRYMSENTGEKMHALQSGQQIDITVLKRNSDRLQCDEECAIAERNKRLAEAFDRKQTEERPSPYISYSFALQQEAKTNFAFVKMVEDTLEELILKVRKSNQAELSHYFPPMKTVHRRVVHELAGHYGCRTQSYDAEPKRNTVVIATKGSLIPPFKLYTQYCQQGPPKPLVLLGDKVANFPPFRLETLEKNTKKPAGPDYFDDQYED